MNYVIFNIEFLNSFLSLSFSLESITKELSLMRVGGFCEQEFEQEVSH